VSEDKTIEMTPNEEVDSDGNMYIENEPNGKEERGGDGVAK
jgi:hypothetical protein